MTDQPPEGGDARLLRLASLLQIEADLRSAVDRSEIQFIAANETHRILPYEQIVVWQRTRDGKPRIAAISGVPDPDQKSPFVVWLTRLAQALHRESGDSAPRPLDPADLPDAIAGDWASWISGHAVWCPFRARGEAVDAGMIVIRPDPFAEADLSVIQRLADAYGFAWWALDPRTAKRAVAPASGWFWRLLKPSLLVLFAAAMFIPIRQSALAPAEVTPRDPVVVTSPISGVIESMHVAPNQPVAEGTLLFSLDRTALRNQATLTEKAVAVAQADYQRARQKAFSDPRSKGEVALLAAEVEQKQAELAYHRELLRRAEVRADRPGIAIYADARDWVGKPVTVGEKVMALADPGAIELTLWVPVSDAISIIEGAEILLFLDTDPLNPLQATLVRAAYEAEEGPDGVLAYRVRARLVDPAARPRIGLKGTGKIHGEEVSLFFFLMRRPIASLRRTIGF